MVMRRRRYADGGKVVVTEESREANRRARERRQAAAAGKPAPLPSQVTGTGALRKAADAIKNRRRDQEEALGLKDGGMVRYRSGKRGKRC